MQKRHLRLIITPPDPSLFSIITDMVLWLLAVFAFSFGVYPAIWGQRVESVNLYILGAIGLSFLVSSSLKEMRKLDSFTFWRRVALALTPFLARLLRDC